MNGTIQKAAERCLHLVPWVSHKIFFRATEFKKAAATLVKKRSIKQLTQNLPGITMKERMIRQPGVRQCRQLALLFQNHLHHETEIIRLVTHSSRCVPHFSYQVQDHVAENADNESQLNSS